MSVSLCHRDSAVAQQYLDLSFEPFRPGVPAVTLGNPKIMVLYMALPRLGDLPWALLGVHSAQLDSATRDLMLDELLVLNYAWYDDILSILTER